MEKSYSRRDILKISLLAGMAAGLKVDSLLAQTSATKGDSPTDIYLQKYPFVLPPLGYEFAALEPFIDARTMQIHYEKHHGAYVINLNEAIATDPASQKKTLGEILAGLDQIPENIRTKVRNNGGGHLNHSLFWPVMKKEAKWNPQSPLAKKISESFGSKEEFLKQFAASAMSVFGSGWAWVILNKGKLELVTSPNQDSPWFTGIKPLLGIDVWEHAYYLKYQNRRGDYVKAFEEIINWDETGKRYSEQTSS